MTEQFSRTSVISKSRLEFLFDGVFAIAITILVLELKVPDLLNHRSVGELALALRHERATFGSYLLSFFVLGIFWYRHNHQYHHYTSITLPMLVMHFVQLAAAAFFPFCAALFGQYAFNPLAGLIYVSCIFVYSLMAMGNWLTAKHAGVLGAGMTDDESRKRVMRGLRGLVMVAALVVFYGVKVIA